MDSQMANDILDEIEALLRRMLMLATRAAEDDCSDAERAALQRRMAGLRRELDQAAEMLQQDGPPSES